MNGQHASSAPDTLQQTALARLGGITRELHEALAALGADAEMRRVVEEIPDARDRLQYVSHMTESAAHKVLGLVEAAKPQCALVATKGREITRALRGTVQADSPPQPDLHALLQACGAYVERATAHADYQGSVLGDIMLAQDFQDLSGQVIKKVVDIINRTEQQLVQLLVDTVPPTACRSTPGPTTLQGPQVPDKALKQDDVDDLLASLGF